MQKALQITFLGTGTSQGIPVIGSDHPVCLSADPRDKRLRVSALISWDDKNYVVDCGPDFREQMLRSGVKRLDGVLFTHEHADHTAGIDDIRPFFFRQGDIPIYAHERVVRELKIRFAYIFDSEDRYPGAPGVDINLVNKDIPFFLGDKRVVPIEASHNRIDVLGYRINGLTYLTDVKRMAEEEEKKVRGSKVLVVNALRKEAHHSHFNLEEALAFVERVAPERAYFTHISHHLGFHQDVQAQLPKNVFLAHDNLTVTV
ncbi:MBL fold metallo-hydrolase [Maribacter sp. 2307ULW6-5]|uniref:MBL fold metallo-hydrolase n=1 Tax=Maribacter sp. 2307ULW6-5 TaxID=3386275 RepID=UPI0039BCCFD9